MRVRLFTLGIFLAATFGLGLSLVSAASDNITIRLFAGEDISPPTTPEFTSVVPVSSSQIDVVWTAATDDIILSGYRLFRDSIQIATTTLTSYSDTGLSASTTYTYTVDAYDSFDKISSTSLPVSTTTLEIILPPVATTSSEVEILSTASIAHAQLGGITVTAGQDLAVVDWKTSTPAKYILRWGRTTSYELGAISGGVYKRTHNTTINQLEPGTKYFYELVVIDGRNTPGVVSRGNFTTLPSIITLRPANVLYLKATTEGESVRLDWQNPITPNFSKVRIVRSHLFYPQTPYDGALVYEGVGNSRTDTEALKTHSPQYYTVFVYDTAGNISSGAIAKAALGRISSEVLIPSSTGTSSPHSSSSLPPAPVDVGEETVLSALEITLKQGSLLQTLDGQIILAADSPYVISIPIEALPPHLKTIIATIQNPTDNKTVSAYLLRLNAAGDRYEAVVAPPMVSGQARIILEVFDYNAATVRRISNTLLFEKMEEPVFFPDRLFVYPISWLIISLLALISIVGLWWFMFRRRREREDNP